MIIETNTDLFYDIQNVWSYQIYKKYNFFDWINAQGAIINRSKRITSTEVKFYSNDTIIHGIDYLEFASDQDYFMFVLKYL